VVVAATVVWFYAALAMVYGLFVVVFDADPYADRNNDLWIGWAVLALGLVDIALGVFLVSGVAWARITANVAAIFWFVVEIYTALWYATEDTAATLRWACLVLAVLNLVLLVLLNNSRARTYFALRRQWRTQGRAATRATVRRPR
jgi:hypothetical protein